MLKPVLHNQSLYDFAVQHCGSVSAVIAIAVANGISPTAPIAPGTELIVPDDAILDNDIVSFYEYKKVLPATALRNDLLIAPGGIGHMNIGGTFIVS